MKLHANAALSLNGRRRMVAQVVEQGRSITHAAEAAGPRRVHNRTDDAELRSSRPAFSLCPVTADPTSSRSGRSPEQLVQLLAALRRLRFTAPELSELLGLPISTISGILRRIGMGKLGRLGLEPARRYERERPGELIHIDVKKLGRIAGGAGHRFTGRGPGAHRNRGIGWDAVHVAIDDATRLAYVEVLPDEKATTAIGFLRRAIRHFARYGITVERVITDNGSPYRSTTHAIACRTHGIRHLRTRPYRPQTNGKAERFIRTMLNGWAYGAIYASSTERTKALDGWLHHYNHHRPHQALGRQTPITRLNNLLGTYS